MKYLCTVLCCIKINVCKEGKVMIQQKKGKSIFLILMKRKMTCLFSWTLRRLLPPTLHNAATLLQGPEPTSWVSPTPTLVSEGEKGVVLSPYLLGSYPNSGGEVSIKSAWMLRLSSWCSIDLGPLPFFQLFRFISLNMSRDPKRMENIIFICFFFFFFANHNPILGKCSNCIK